MPFMAGSQGIYTPVFMAGNQGIHTPVPTAERWLSKTKVNASFNDISQPTASFSNLFTEPTKHKGPLSNFPKRLT